MATFKLLDPVQLTVAIALSSDIGNAVHPPAVAPADTMGTIVEVLEPEQAFLVELFGDWVTLQEGVGLVKTNKADDPGAFRETLGVETLRADQMRILTRSNAVKLDRLGKRIVKSSFGGLK